MTSNQHQDASSSSMKIQAIGSWIRDILAEMVSEISMAVLDDMSENSLIESKNSGRMLALPDIAIDPAVTTIETRSNVASGDGSTISAVYCGRDEYSDVRPASTRSKWAIISRMNDIYIPCFPREDAVFKSIIYKLSTDNDSPTSTATNHSIDETDLVLVEPIDRSVIVVDDWSGL